VTELRMVCMTVLLEDSRFRFGVVGAGVSPWLGNPNFTVAVGEQNMGRMYRFGRWIAARLLLFSNRARRFCCGPDETIRALFYFGCEGCEQ
jgi:hypothetical protein